MSAVKFNAHFSCGTNSQEETATALIKTGVAQNTESLQKETKPQYDAANNVLRVGGNPRLEEKILFIENYDFIWENRERIINDVALSETRLYFSGLSLAYVSGGSITLGMLLTLWSNGQWTTKCPFCGGTVRIFAWGGSPLTGNNKYHGFCTSCKRDRDDAGDNFIQNVRSAIRMINERKAKFAQAHPDRSSKTVAPEAVGPLILPKKRNTCSRFPNSLMKWLNGERPKSSRIATLPSNASFTLSRLSIWEKRQMCAQLSLL